MGNLTSHLLTFYPASDSPPASCVACGVIPMIRRETNHKLCKSNSTTTTTFFVGPGILFNNNDTSNKQKQQHDISHGVTKKESEQQQGVTGQDHIKLDCPPVVTLFKMPCSHLYCSKCITHYMSSCLFPSMDRFPLHCCGKELPLKLIERACQDQEAARSSCLKNISGEKDIDHHEEEDVMIIGPETTPSQLLRLYFAEKQRRSSISLWSSWKPSSTSSSSGSGEGVADDDYVHVVKTMGYKLCPSCKRGIEKSGGCDLIVW